MKNYNKIIVLVFLTFFFVCLNTLILENKTSNTSNSSNNVIQNDDKSDEIDNIEQLKSQLAQSEPFKMVYEKLLGDAAEFNEWTDIKIDAWDNIYLAGTTESYGKNGRDFILMKLNNKFEQLWNATWGGSGVDMCQAMILDSLNNSFLAGYSSSFGANGYDFCVVKFNSSGIRQWNTTWGLANNDYCSSITMDSSDNLYLAGDHSIPDSDRDVLLVKIDNNGNYVWYRIWGQTLPNPYTGDCQIDSFNNIYVCGHSQGFGGLNHVHTFLLKYSQNGNLYWGKNYTFGYDDQCYSMEIDETNNIYLGVRSFTMPSYKYVSNIVKCDNNGNLLWNKKRDVEENDYVFDIILDNSNIYIGGTWTLIKFNETKGFIWASDKCIRDFKALALDSEKNIYIVGQYGSFYAYLAKLEQMPWISIDNPKNYQLFGNSSINFDLSISIYESDLNITWYSLNNGLNYTFTGTSNKINQTAWDTCGNGTVSIIFYANNTAGNLAFREIIVQKDCNPPNISIIKPIIYKLYGNKPPYFELTFIEGNLNTTWYMLNGSLVKNIFTGNSGYINRTRWDELGNGTLSIRFYANDTLGNNASKEITVLKDIYPPEIDILFPTSFYLFSNNSPNYEVNIIGLDLNTTWYTLNGDSIKYNFTGDSGFINQTGWDALGNGTIYIRFYANDSVNNMAFKEVIVLKDCKGPQINVLSPYQNQLYGNNSPYFELLIFEANLLNASWYTINGSLAKYNFTGNSGLINQTGWGGLGNGTLYIRFYGNDTFGNIGFQDVFILKDMIPPEIIIEFPFTNQFYGNNSPYFELSILEANINATWYTLNMTSFKYNFAGNSGYINQTGWNEFGNGIIYIKFYMNDTASNNANKEIFVYKDKYTPNINILSPNQYKLYGNNTPYFNVNIVDLNLNKTWYILNGSSIKYYFTGDSGFVNQTGWNALGNSTLYIRFYANDTANNIAFKDIILCKDCKGPLINILTPYQYYLYGNNSPYFEASFLEANLNKTWYTLNGSSFKYYFSDISGFINQTGWNALGNGTLNISFYANDTFGNIGFQRVMLLKDCIPPDLTIQSPNPNELFGIETFNFELIIIEGNLNRTWYTLNGSLVKYDFTGNSWFVNKTGWDALGKGIIYIKFYANDTLGNAVFRELIVFKDPSLRMDKWNRTWGIDISEDRLYDIAVYNKTGDVYLIGSNYTGYDVKEIFLVKLNKYGIQKWNVSWSDKSGYDNYGFDVAVDQTTGYIYVVGTVNYDPKLKLVIIKFDSNGKEIWNVTCEGKGIPFTEMGSIWGKAITIDSAGDIYVTGFNASSTLDVFIAKYDSYGRQKWNKTWDDGYDEQATDIIIDLENNIYISGWFENSSGEGTILLSYDNNGNFLWEKIYYEDGYEIIGTAITIDAVNNIYITGTKYDYFDEMVLLKYSNAGSFQWIRTWRNTTWETTRGNGVAIDLSGNIIVAISSSDDQNLILQIYNPSGIRIFESFWGGNILHEKHALCITIDFSGNIYLGGTIYNGPSEEDDFIIVKNPTLKPISYTNYTSGGGYAPMDGGNGGGGNGKKESDILPTIIIISIISGGVVVGVIVVLIKKGVIGTSKTIKVASRGSK